MPRNVVLDTIDLGVVLRTCQRSRITLDGVNFSPSPRQGECNGVATDACKAVDEYSLIFRGSFSNILCNCSSSLSMRFNNKLVRVSYLATGSGVTPNQASSVIQIPSSYFEKILKR